MSFLDTNNAEYLSARITQRGRNAIAKGNFDITYFVVGDSEFDYSNPFSGLTGGIGSTGYQGTFAPLDKDTSVKYPIKYNESGTIYGSPVAFNQVVTLRNSIGPAGFVSEYKPFSLASNSGTTVSNNATSTGTTFNIRGITGGNTLTVPKDSGVTYNNCEFITLTFNTLTGTSNNLIGFKTNSLIYKIIDVSGATTGSTQIITVDRILPNFQTSLAVGVSGHVICNKCEVEYPPSDVDNTCLPLPPNNNDQRNPWTLNVVYGKKPIGLSGETGSSTLRSLSGYTSNKYIGIKELLGYGSSGQIFVDYTGGTITTPTSFVNSFAEEISLPSEKQRAISIVHFSEVGDIVNDPDRFFRYDDYISTSSDNTVALDYSDTPISDEKYFQVYLPFLLYHRNTDSTLGALFQMTTGSTNDKYLVSNVTNSSVTKYRDLIDEYNNKVGKVFVNKKTIVFDDPEIVACLDYKSNRRYTLPAPKLRTVSTVTGTPLLANNTTKLYLTYHLNYSSDNKYSSIPCSYIIEVTGSTGGSDVTFSFGNEFGNMYSSVGDMYRGFVANEFFILAQTGTTTSTVNNAAWKKIDFTGEVTVSGGVIVPSSLTGITFTLNNTKYAAGTTFDLTSHYVGHNMTFTGDTGAYFGDEQPFPGSVKVVRASDIEEMNFMVNLPTGTFSSSQNPTYVSGNPRITEVALLNANKETMVMAKTSRPIDRSGTQVFSVKLDF